MDARAAVGEACRVAGIRVAADDVGAGNAGLRLLSQLRSTSSRSTCRSSRAAPSTRPRSRSSARCATWPTAGARWSSPRASRPRPSSTSCARWGSGAGQGYLLGRPTDPPSTEPIDLDAWGAARLARRPPADDAHERTAGGTRRDFNRVAVDARPIHARLPPRTRAACRRDARETALGWFDRRDRRKVAVVVTSDGRRVHVPIDPPRRRIPPRPSSLASGLGGLLGLITGSRRDRGTRRDER